MPPITAIIAISALTLLIAVPVFINYYEYHGIGPQGGVLRHGQRDGDREIAITFDDGPSLQYTPEILDILADKQARATFFLTGQMAEEYPDIAARIAAEGHETGNHTYSHANMIFLNRDDLVREIEMGETAVATATGKKPVLFRPPRGLFNNTVRRALIDRGYKVILWSVSATDWGPLGPAAVARRIKRYTHPGAIILFHDGGALVKNNGGNRETTVTVLPDLIDFFRAEGYTLVTAGEMLEKNPC